VSPFLLGCAFGALSQKADLGIARAFFNLTIYFKRLLFGIKMALQRA